MTRTNLGIRASSRINSTSLSAAILALSPVGYWKLNETSGTTAADSSGNARNGTYTGTYTLNAVNGSVSLGGGYITIADNAAFSVGAASGLTVFALIRPSSTTGTNRRFIVSKGAASNYEWDLNANITSASADSLDGQVYVLSGATVTASERSAANVLSISSWQAVAADFPATTGTRFSVWRNSSSAISTSTVSTSGSVGDGTAQVIIGQRGDLPANFQFQGAIAHVALFPGRLNSTQIGTLMSAAQAEGWF